MSYNSDQYANLIAQEKRLKEQKEQIAKQERELQQQLYENEQQKIQMALNQHRNPLETIEIDADKRKAIEENKLANELARQKIVFKEGQDIANKILQARQQGEDNIRINGWMLPENKTILEKNLFTVKQVAQRKYHGSSPTRPDHTTIWW